MSTAEFYANKVVTTRSELKQIDPLIIAAIVSAILGIITMIKNCKAAPSEGLEVVRNPRLWEWRKARRVIKRSCPQCDIEVYEELKKLRNNVNLEELTNLYNEADERRKLLEEEESTVPA